MLFLFAVSTIVFQCVSLNEPQPNIFIGSYRLVYALSYYLR